MREIKAHLASGGLDKRMVRVRFGVISEKMWTLFFFQILDQPAE